MADHLADALNTMKTHEMAGLEKCTVRSSKILKSVLDLLKKHQYIKDYSLVDDGKGGHFEITLAGRINDCGVIKPRFPVKRADWTKEEQKFIPGVGVGLLIVTTPKGIMSNTDALENKVGGRLIAYVY